MGIVNNLLRRERKPYDEIEEKPQLSRRADPPTPLMLLLQDAGGVASYQLNVFPSGKAAEFFLDSTLRGQMPEGAVLFWGLSWEPASHPDYAQAEPLVLIRDSRKAVVYPFSFANLESAYEFIRHEMNRGLDIGQVMVLWAVPAIIEVDFWGRSTIIPPAAPVRSFQPTRVTSGVASRASRQSIAPEMTVESGPATNGHPGAPTDDAKYLSDSDISEAILMMRGVAEAAPTSNSTAADSRVVPMPRRSTASYGSAAEPVADTATARSSSELIEFTPAAQKVQEARASHAMIVAWANVSLAIDEALDVYVARQVTAKLVWNRICRAIVSAVETKDRLETEHASMAAEAEALAQAETAKAEAKALADAAKAEATEAEAAEERATLAASKEQAERARTFRRAWLNISWTLEEASYAYALEHKSRSIRGWKFAAIAIGEAVAAKSQHEATLRLAWSNAGQALSEGANVYVARREIIRGAWHHISIEIARAVNEKRRMGGVFAAMRNTGQALHEAVEAMAYRDGMIATWDMLACHIAAAADAQMYQEAIAAAWENAGTALGEMCKSYVKKQKRAIRAWGRLATAFGGVVEARIQLDGYIAAWQNAGAAIREAVIAQQRHEAFVVAWTNAGAFFVEAVEARVFYEMSVRTWNTLSEAILEAVSEKFRRDALIAAWTTASSAIYEAVRAAIAKQVGLEVSWTRISTEVLAGAGAQRFHEMSVTSWTNAGVAMAEAGNAYLFQLKSRSAWRNACRALVEAIPLHNFKMAAIEGWNNACIALKEAVVAEAKMRIAQAGLDRALMAEVDKTVREAQKAVRKAVKDGKASPAPVVSELTLAANPMVVDAVLGDAVESTATAVEEPVIEEPTIVLDAPIIEEIVESEFEVVAAIEDEVELPGEGEGEIGPFGIWRPAARRWEPREEPFGGFNSPPGRFLHREKKGDQSVE